MQLAQRAVDLQRAAAFYEALLETAPSATYDPPGLVFFDLDGVRLLLDRVAPSALYYLSVTDLEGQVERLRSLGTVIDSEPHCIFSHSDDSLGRVGTEEWQAFIRDSEGNLVGLVQQRPTSE